MPHFRTDALREVGGWDPYNVTEDADLGVRLARFGYRTTMIDSTTYEEAPARLGQWMKQRTRWFKGWLQTWLVHMRQPLRLLRELGPAGFVTVQLVVGGTVLAALVHIVFVAALLVHLARHGASGLGEAIGVVPFGAYGATLVAGYAVSGLLGYIGLRRRGLVSAAWALAAMPLHWMLLSLAAWRALIQLMVDPYYWEKTEHGLARTSRLARAQRPQSGGSTPHRRPD